MDVARKHHNVVAGNGRLIPRMWELEMQVAYDENSHGGTVRLNRHGRFDRRVMLVAKQSDVVRLNLVYEFGGENFPVVARYIRSLMCSCGEANGSRESCSRT